MKRLVLLASVAFSVMPQVGRAQALPGQDYSWSGFTFGGHLGYHRAPVEGSLGGYSGYAAGVFERSGLGNLGLSPKGLNAGLQAGYALQFGRVIAGIDADASLIANTSSSNTTVATTIPASSLTLVNTVTTTAKAETSWLGTLRGRLGFAVWDRLVVFGTAGLAMGQLRASVGQTRVTPVVPLSGPVTTSTAVDSAASASWTRTGWAVGAGVDMAISRSISLRFEALTYSLGERTVTVVDRANPALSTSLTFKNRGDLMRLGANYAF